VDNDAAVANWTECLIEAGTGLAITVEGGPLHAHEARRISWQQGQEIITALEGQHAGTLLLIRFGFLRLAEISLVEHRQKWRPQSAAGRIAWRRLSARGRLTALHRWHEHEAGAPQPAQSRPNRSEAWSVLAALRYQLGVEAIPPIPPRAQKLVELTDRVHPSLFLFESQKGRDRELLLSEGLSEYSDPLESALMKDERRERRLAAVEERHARLVAEMVKTLPDELKSHCS
jgi:hypothetical protein